MILDYLALALLVIIVLLAVYGVVAVYGAPYEIAKARSHPHAEAIGAVTWVSLLTLGGLWPLLWVWALAYDPERGWGFGRDPRGGPAALARLEARVAVLEQGREAR